MMIKMMLILKKMVGQKYSYLDKGIDIARIRGYINKVIKI
jgi:hypothetical protein